MRWSGELVLPDLIAPSISSRIVSLACAPPSRSWLSLEMRTEQKATAAARTSAFGDLAWARMGVRSFVEA